MLFISSFCETSEKVIRPALKEGRIVIADRWYYSTIAYQGYASKNKETYLKFIRNFTYLRKYIVNVKDPDLSLILMAPWDVLHNRFLNRSQELDKMESKDLEFKKKVYEYYKDICFG